MSVSEVGKVGSIDRLRMVPLWFWVSVLAIMAIATQAVPVTGASGLSSIVDRTYHIVIFLAAITVVADLCKAAGLFDVVGRFLASRARGNTALLYCGVVVLGLACTTILSLDTTAVLLTPVVIRMCRYSGLSPLLFAMAAIWLANAGSLILPVSNLTNLLAMSSLDISATDYFGVMWLPGLVAGLVPVVLLGILHRRTIATPYVVTEDPEVRDPVLLIASGIVILAIVPAILLNVPVDVVAVGALVALGVVFLVRKREALGWGLVPWQLVVLTMAMFVAMTGLTNLGGTGFVASTLGDRSDFGQLLQTAWVSTLAANVFNNLPAYLMLEGALPPGARDQLFAVLIGVNAGPGILFHGSLATLLWLDRCKKEGVVIRWRQFGLFGVVAVAVTLPLASWALAITLR